MTAIDVIYGYSGDIGPEQVRALSDAFDIYGVRRIHVDERERTITVEYDATRMTNEIVAAVLRSCGVAIGAKIDRLATAGA